MDIPFELREGRVWTSVRINGVDTQAIFDTGADGTALDVDLAGQLGLRMQEGAKGSTVAGQVQLRKASRVVFEVAGRSVPTGDAVVLPLAAQLSGLRAILGFDLLRQIPFTVDYAGRCIRMGILPEGERLPFVIARDIRPTAWLETLGDRFGAHLDTGSAQGISLPLGWIRTHAPGLLGQETRREILGDAVSTNRFTLDQVRLGTAELGNVPAEAVSAEGGSFADQQNRWANVGNGLLRRFRLGVDGERRIVVLQLVE